MQRDKNKELEARNKELERRLAEEKSLRVAAEAKYRSLRNQVSGAPNEEDNNDQRTKGNQPTQELLPSENLEGGQLNMSASTTQQDDATIRLERSPLSHSSVSKSSKYSIRPSPPLSRNNSFDKNPIVIGVNSKSFTGLGSADPSSPIRDANSVASTQTSSTINNEIIPVPTEKSCLSTSPPPNTGPNNRCTTNPTTHFDPLGTPKCKSRAIEPVPDFSAQIHRTASDSYLPLRNDDTSTSKTTNHFDPMGTPKCHPKTVEDAMNAMKNNGFYQLPDLDMGDVPVSSVMLQHPNRQQQQIEEEDPFDEIVRHGRG